MYRGKGSGDLACPETHFWCPAQDFCLPVFVRCNGIYDCPDHKDEERCDKFSCPGFYRCRASKVCVHVTHVCDDLPTCPQGDDELLCGQQCPVSCTCHGLAFFCSQVFEARQFPDLRYLDVRGSGMDVHQLEENRMLIHLGLATCGVKSVSNVTFPNLRSLDLSDNLLTEVSGNHFRYMAQLTVLFLAGNPLSSVFKASTRPVTELRKLTMLDLSRIRMPSVNHSLFMEYPHLESLNLSHSGVELLQWNITQMPAASIREVDLRGCVLAEVPREALRGLNHLQSLYAENFKLCCPSVLPLGLDPHQCYAPSDDVSSCDNLLGSSAHRNTVAVVATLAFLGNIISLLVRVCTGNTWRLSNSGVVFTHLAVADLGTGLYLGTVAMADRLLAGDYVWQDDTWRRGTVCHLAGVLALSCRHAAILFITILSLDRSLHKLPALTVRLTPAKVKVLCVMVWISGLVLASVPLKAQWRFYGQQAVCVPLPHKRSNTLEFQYTFGFMVLASSAMFILCFLLEVVTSVSGRVTITSNMSRDTSGDDSRFVVLGAMTSGLVYNIACLVPTDGHDDRQAAVHTALVYFGSVVSCALNPFLHLYGVRVTRSKRVKEERLQTIISRTRS